MASRPTARYGANSALAPSATAERSRLSVFFATQAFTLSPSALACISISIH